MNIYIILFIVVIIIVLLFRNKKEHLEFNDDDYIATIQKINSIFVRSPKYNTLKNDPDFLQAIYYFNIIHDFYVSLQLDLKNKQEILYCMLPPDSKDLCRGFRIGTKQQFDSDRLQDKLESNKAYILKTIIGKLNIIYNDTNNLEIISIQKQFAAQLNYIIANIYNILQI